MLLVLAIVATSASEAGPLKAEARGVYYLTPVEGVRRTNLASLDAWDNPSVVGVAIRAAWSELQRSPDQFDWSYLDTAIRIAEAKKSSLRSASSLESTARTGFSDPRTFYN